MKDIDFIKLLEQEPEFAEYCKKAVWFAMLHADNGDMLKSLYNFYQIGITEEQLEKFVTNAMRFQ